jgi:predicted RND superfamily exporter protein
MISAFYKHYCKHILVAILLTMPFLGKYAESMPQNNNIETWLPKDSLEWKNYNQFKADFGAEDVVLIAVEKDAVPPSLIDSLASRLETLPTVRSCWSPKRFQEAVEELQVDEAEASERMEGLLISRQQKLVGLAVAPSDLGLKNRTHLVEEIRAALAYCQVTPDQYHLTGSSVISAELDKLGGKEANKVFFISALCISFILLLFYLRNWKTALGFWIIMVWSIYATLAAIKLCGGEMNFIMGSVSVLVMIFTISMSIQYLGYFQEASHTSSQVGIAFKEAWQPCFFAQLTTLIGLLSLQASDILPVRQFGMGSAIGCIIATLVGMFITPAVLVMFPLKEFKENQFERFFQSIGVWSVLNRRKVIWTTSVLTVFTLVGIGYLNVILEPLDFLPKNSRVVNDLKVIEKQLTCVDSVEVVVDFDGMDISFCEKLSRIRNLQANLQTIPVVRHVMSAASFFPTTMPDDSRQLFALLKTAQNRSKRNDFMAEGERLWRLSLRIAVRDGKKAHNIVDQIREFSSAETPLTVTGMAPLIKQAQKTIFEGFWTSFGSAFLIISTVMAIAMRGGILSIISMIPNIIPLVLAYGVLGWLNIPLDIGMMMTGSIAMGLAVDGTFHHMSIWKKYHDTGFNREESAIRAIWQKSVPMAKSTILSCMGMMALAMSSFKPTYAFGMLMAAMLFLAFLGDLMLLPALLSLGYKNVRRNMTHLNSKNEQHVGVSVILKYPTKVDEQGLITVPKKDSDRSIAAAG